MKERDTRVLILTSEQCRQFGFALLEDCEQAMPFVMVDREEVIALILNRQPKVEDDDDTSALEEEVMKLLADKYPQIQLIVTTAEDRSLLGFSSGENDVQPFMFVRPDEVMTMLLTESLVSDELPVQDRVEMSEVDKARKELLVSYFTAPQRWT